EDVTVVVWLMTVEAVRLTVVCPLFGSWISRTVPLMEASWPETPGGPPLPAAFPVRMVVGVVVDATEEPPPHAARARPAAPASAAGKSRRRGVVMGSFRFLRSFV